MTFFFGAVFFVTFAGVLAVAPAFELGLGLVTFPLVAVLAAVGDGFLAVAFFAVAFLAAAGLAAVSFVAAFLAVFFATGFLVSFLAAAFLVVVAFLAGSFFTAAFFAGAFLVAVFLVAVFFVVFVSAFLVTAFLVAGLLAFAATGLVTLASVAGTTMDLETLTGPEGPLGCKNSPNSTAFLKAALNNASKLGALMS